MLERVDWFNHWRLLTLIVSLGDTPGPTQGRAQKISLDEDERIIL